MSLSPVVGPVVAANVTTRAVGPYEGYTPPGRSHATSRTAHQVDLLFRFDGGGEATLSDGGIGPSLLMRPSHGPPSTTPFGHLSMMLGGGSYSYDPTELVLSREGVPEPRSRGVGASTSPVFVPREDLQQLAEGFGREFVEDSRYPTMAQELQFEQLFREGGGHRVQVAVDTARGPQVLSRFYPPGSAPPEVAGFLSRVNDAGFKVATMRGGTDTFFRTWERIRDMVAPIRMLVT